MLSKIYAIIAIIGFSYLSKGCISDYLKGSDADLITHYEKVIADDGRATAVLSKEYKETNVSIKGLRANSYEFTYSYQVDSATYSGSHSFLELPKSPTIEVYYWKANPSHSYVDLANKLSQEKAKTGDKGPLWWGIFFGVVALLCLVGFIKEMRAWWASL